MTLPLVVDAASIRTDAGSVGHEYFPCADHKSSELTRTRHKPANMH